MELVDYSLGDRDAFVRSSTLGKVVDFILILSILVSYIPQYLRIKNYRPKADGISPMYILSRAIYAGACLANILVLPSAFKKQQRCREQISISKCMIEMMDIWQFTADWIGSHIILIIYIYHSSSHSFGASKQRQPQQEQGLNANHQQVQRPDRILTREQPPGRLLMMYSPLKVPTILVIFFEAILLIPSLFFAINPRVQSPGYYILVQTWSFGTVGLSSISSLVYSLPQLYYTWSQRRVGALSLLTIAIQIPLYFLVAASLAMQYRKLDDVSLQGRWFAAWNPWISLIIKGFQEGIILALCIYVYGNSTVGEATPALGENTPLLSSSQNHEDGPT